jgi:hypothetical protein
MKKRRFLKKVGTERVFGWTPVLAAKKDMVECNENGIVIVSEEEIARGGVQAIRIFELGMMFRTVGEKTLASWIEENAMELNALPLDIQGLVIAKWQKAFPGKPMPDVCTFMVQGNSETGEPVAEEDTEPAVNMKE